MSKTIEEIDNELKELLEEKKRVQEEIYTRESSPRLNEVKNAILNKVFLVEYSNTTPYNISITYFTKVFNAYNGLRCDYENIYIYSRDDQSSVEWTKSYNDTDYSVYKKPGVKEITMEQFNRLKNIATAGNGEAIKKILDNE